MTKVAKRYETASQQVDRMRTYPLTEAVEVLSKFPKAKFDETVELSAHLGVDPRQSNQMVRGVVNLPHGSGKKVRVIVFTEMPEAAMEAGADEAGLEDLIKRVEEGWTDFDVAIATPAAMKEVRRVARVLGPRGLMPNPKSGTVTEDTAAAVKAVKAGGRVEFKMDKTANIGVIVGKRSFSAEQLEENVKTVVDAIGKLRPEGLKGQRYIKSMSISGTMTPGVKLDQSLFASY
ncbi:MAG: large subunit ribosomal protein L1 [Puniceicoccaceae bacterium 5H]|nr:MAG: large subunit ribosomal protein L1 [Puniceicoccaceae bacterium 5H]